MLLRVFVADYPAQCEVAVEAMEQADIVGVSVQSLCEFVWVLGRNYGTARADIAAAIRRLIDTRNVLVNRPAVEAGLLMLEAGGDFADGVIAFEGRWLGGEKFVSFDREAVKVLAAQGQAARLLAAK
ncbi:type II toxin-antitoxin system VapC family toxin [Rhizobium herbae]|uniref:Type II toxin-antitoxin system VapC family toxin n=1 Tax=Rhizobium herbae TaxID=508661 RepID=A0ABS7H7F2_9HYPH|nr:type II toxin-antitoxin system VapC family toxin [Rhizobium herbae]